MVPKWRCCCPYKASKIIGAVPAQRALHAAAGLLLAVHAGFGMYRVRS